MVQDFSVLIPARGSCNYLSKTLESISASSIAPKEVILVDDGISKLAIKDIDKFNSRLNLTILPNQGQGLVDALNTGLIHCKTPLIARLDADDLAAPNRFELQIKTLASDPAIVVLGGQAVYIDEHDEVTGYSNYISGRLDNQEEFKRSCMVAHPSTMIRTSVALEVGGYRSICTDGRIDLAEDFDLWLRISSKGQVHNLSDRILLYRQHKNQISTMYTPSQVFATTYISFVNRVELTNSYFRYIKLSLGQYKLNFLVDSNKSLAPFIPLKKRLQLLSEGLLIFFGISSGLFPRIIRKLIRSFD